MDELYGSVKISWLAQFGDGEDAIAKPVLTVISAEGYGKLNSRGQIVELYDKLRPSLFGYLVCLGLMAPQADDIIQESFIRFFRFVNSGGKIENNRSWLFRVAHNLALNLQKSESRMVSDVQRQNAAHTERFYTGFNPEELYLRKEQIQLLRTAVSNLSKVQRECLHLRAEGLRYREIAEVLGISVSSVGESLKRAVAFITSELYE